MSDLVSDALEAHGGVERWRPRAEGSVVTAPAAQYLYDFAEASSDIYATRAARTRLQGLSRPGFSRTYSVTPVGGRPMTCSTPSALRSYRFSA